VICHPFCHPLHQPVANHPCFLSLLVFSCSAFFQKNNNNDNNMDLLLLPQALPCPTRDNWYHVGGSTLALAAAAAAQVEAGDLTTATTSASLSSCLALSVSSWPPSSLSWQLQKQNLQQQQPQGSVSFVAKTKSYQQKGQQH
jgi:hypothetical protein